MQNSLPTGVKQQGQALSCPFVFTTNREGHVNGLSDWACKERSDEIAKRSGASRYFNILCEDKIKADPKRSNKKRTSHLLVLVAPHRGGHYYWSE